MDIEKFPYDNIEELMLRINEIFTSLDSELVRKNETMMRNMMQDAARFTESVMSIVINEDSFCNKFPDIGTKAMIILNRYFQGVNGSLSDSEKERIMNAVIKGIQSQKTFSQVAKNLLLLIRALSTDKFSGVKIWMNIYLNVQEKLKSEHYQDLFPTLLLIESTVLTPHPTNSIDQICIFNNLYPPLLSSCSNLLIKVSEQINFLEKGDIQEQSVQQFLEMIETLPRWAYTFKLLLSAQSHKRLPEEEFTENEELSRLLIDILGLKVPKQLGSFPEYIIPVMANNSNVSDMLNDAKSFALECIYFQIQTNQELEKQKKGNIPNSTLSKSLFIIGNDGSQLLIKSLTALCKGNYSDLEEKLQNRSFVKCLSNSLKVLSQLVTFNRTTSDIFFESKDAIVIDIVLTLVSATKEHIKLFKENPREYLELRASKDLKKDYYVYQALNLVCELCDHIDGALSYTVTQIKNIIEYSFVSNEKNQILSQYPCLTKISESIILSQTHPNIRVEACLFVLSAIAKVAHRRDDILDLIRSIFISFQDYFCREECNKLIRARTCYFMENYLSLLFQRNFERHQRYMMFLVQSAGMELLEDQDEKESIEIIPELAIQALKTIMSEDCSQSVIVQYIDEIFQIMIHYLQYSKNSDFFVLLLEILETYKREIALNVNLVERFTSALSERMQRELEAISQDSKPPKTNVIINRMCSILTCISGSEEFLQHQAEIEVGLETTFLAVIDSQSLLEEDLLLYVSNSIKVTQSVSPLCWEIFRKMPEILEKYKNNIDILFPSLNQIIVHGTNQITDDKEAELWLIDMAIKSLKPKTSQFSKGHALTGTLILQLLLQSLTIQDEQFERILMSCYEKLQEPSVDFYKARLLGVLLLAFMQDFQITEACFSKNGVLENVMNLIIDKPMVYNIHSYDRKLLTVTLSRFFMYHEVEESIKERFPRILHLLVSYLTFIQKIENIKSVKEQRIEEDENDEEEEALLSEKDVGKKHEKLLKEILNGSNLVEYDVLKNENGEDEEDDDNEIEDAEDNDFDDDERLDLNLDALDEDQANSYVSMIETRLNNLDEFEIFRSVMLKLRENNPGLLKEISGELSEIHKEYLRDILKMRKIVVNHEKMEVKTRKVLTVVKRKDKAEDV